MASQILANVANVAEKAKDMTSATSQKVTDLAASTKDVHDKSWRITSDYGVKQNNTDDWLKVASEDKQGPMLLEDHFAREKVCHTENISPRHD
jgi:catalase